MSIETKGQLIQYTNENDPNSAVNYYPYTVVDAVFTDEGKTKTLMEYLQEEILGTEDSGGALGLQASTVNGGAIGENAKSDSGFAGGKNSKTTNGGAIGLNSIAENGGAVGEKASTLLRTSSLGVETNCFLDTDKTYEKQFKIDLIITNSIKNEAKNINISKAYIKGTRGENIKNYFSIQMNNTETTASKIVATIYTREKITTSPASEYFSVDGKIPIYVDIEYQVEDGSGGSGFSGGYNSKASTGGGVGTNAETISGGAIGQNADSDYGGAVGQNANTTAGCAVGLRAQSEAGGAIGVDSSTRWGGAAGFMSESEHGYAGGWGSYTKSGGSTGMHASSENGGAAGRNAKTENGGAVGQNASSLNGFAGGYKAEGRHGAAVGSEAKLLYNENAAETDRHGKGAAIGRQAVSYHGGSAGWVTRSNNGFAGGYTSATEDGGAVGYAAFARNGFAGGYGAVVGQCVKDENQEIVISNGGSGAAIGYKAQVGTAKGKYTDFSGGAVGQGAVAGNGFAGGYNAQAQGVSAIAIGAGAFADGDYSIVIGSDLSDDHVYSNAAGKYAIAIGTAAQVGAESAVQLGNGTNTTKESLQFMTHKITNGTSTQSSGSDMAEYFEWEDGNINKQDRRGYFVSLSNSKIRLANSNDDYILGVISSEYIASFVGNTAAVNWKNKYLKDIYGDFILDENGEKVINPEFNDKTEYLPRSKRAEWAVVCLIGQIVINDDGTCVPGGYCKVNDNGEGTTANIEDNIKYKVLERLDNNHVRILFK